MKYLIAFKRFFFLGILFLSLWTLVPADANAQGKQFKGKDAIAKLGYRLADIAKKNHISEGSLIKLFEEDSSLNVDEMDNLLYIEKIYTKSNEGINADLSKNGLQNIPPEDAFLLNSKSSSNHTIYLDFNDHILSKTVWNSIINEDSYNAPAFDLDGAPESFNKTERQRIINIWKRVAEDFAPFDVNITTQEPKTDALTRSSASDQTYGIVVLITHSFPICNGGTNCAGASYLNVFAGTNDYAKTALIFYDKLGNGSEKYIAEAISHNVGHSLGLHHHGTVAGIANYSGHGSGITSWAPIMGNSFFKQLSQWTKGEYKNANNQQDDLAIIQKNGLSLRIDDHGNIYKNATLIDQGNAFGTAGVIENSSDIDYFSFNSDVGEFNIDASPASFGANLDLMITAYDSSGKVIGKSSPNDTLSASLLFKTPAKGKYYLAVEGTGNLKSNYSKYGSLGQYTIIGSYTSTNENQSPVAIAKSSVVSGKAPLEVIFDGSSSGDQDGKIVSYIWDFGDGTKAKGDLAEHIFKAGKYNVILTVTDNEGISDTDKILLEVIPSNQAPKAFATASRLSGGTPLEVNFSSKGSNDSDGKITSYHWTFGDGGQSTLASPSYTFKKAGKFNVVLKVVDNIGSSGVAALSIEVLDNSIKIKAPSNLTSRQSGAYLSLYWKDNSNNEAGFYVYKSYQKVSENDKEKLTESPWVRIATVESDRAKYTDYVSNSSIISYKVEAFDKKGNSASSEALKIIVK